MNARTFRHMAVVCLVACGANGLRWERAAHAHDPVEAGRLGQATLVRRAARNRAVPAPTRIAAVLDLLQQELQNPTPDDPSFPSPYTVSEAIQSRLLAALDEAGDAAALAAAGQRLATNARLSKAITIAMGHALAAGPGASPQATLGTARALADLVQNDPSDFIRSRAARALGELASTHAALRPDAVKALMAAMADPARRPARGLSGATEPSQVRLVYGDAAGSLMRLGFDVRGMEVRDKATGAVVSAGSAMPSAKDSGTLAARDALASNGYKVTWSAKKQELKAARGARLILLRAGSDTAVVDGRPQKMDGPATLVDGRLQIPGTFMAPARK